MKKLKRYEFTITIGAVGNTPEEAWEEAVEYFMEEPGSMPKDYKVGEDENGSN